MNQYIRLAIICLALPLCGLLPCGCEEEKQPGNPAPEITLNAAEEITRTSAKLSGRVIAASNSHTDLFRFLYGTSPEMEQVREARLTENGEVSTVLQDLTPGTIYHYCIEAGNKAYRIQSPALTFTTVPNETPTVGEIVLLGQGPVSVILQCAVTDDGGERISARGFAYAPENGEEREVFAPLSEEEQWSLRIGGLERNTRYTARAFADNKIGRAYSEAYSFQTGDAVTIVNAGTLADIIGEEEKYEYQTLNIAGPLNGTDIRLIRDMAGRNIDDEETEGQLVNIDLTDATIVEGGLAYCGARYTENNVVGYDMFGNLSGLRSVKLPAETREIEQNAFRNCVSLTGLAIPGKVESLTPSDGCERLSDLSVSAENPRYMSMDGVVYNKEGEELIWFPEGLSAEEIRFSPTLKRIGDFALQRCKVRDVTLPASLTSIGRQAFHEAEVETVVLPDEVRTVSYGLFQGCRRLTSVTLGSECELLSDYCFDQCPLQHLYVRASLPPTCSENTFTGCQDIFSGCVLHVPEESRDIYRNHPYWKQFTHIQGERQ